MPAEVWDGGTIFSTRMRLRLGINRFAIFQQHNPTDYGLSRIAKLCEASMERGPVIKADPSIEASMVIEGSRP